MILNIPTKIDFGNMKFGHSYTKDYPIHNSTNEVITITNLGRSCSCTEVSADKTQINSGETAIIKVTVKPGSTGIFSRSFWFNLNNQSYTITLTGHAS